MPASAHRFRVVPQFINESVVKNFMECVESAKLDFVNKTVTIMARENVLCHATYAIELFIRHETSIAIDVLDLNQDPYFTLRFRGQKIVSHELDFSYAIGGSLMHKIVWEYSGIDGKTDDKVEHIAPASDLPCDPAYPTPAEALKKYKQNIENYASTEDFVFGTEISKGTLVTELPEKDLVDPTIEPEEAFKRMKKWHSEKK